MSDSSDVISSYHEHTMIFDDMRNERSTSLPSPSPGQPTMNIPTIMIQGETPRQSVNSRYRDSELDFDTDAYGGSAEEDDTWEYQAIRPVSPADASPTSIDPDDGQREHPGFAL